MSFAAIGTKLREILEVVETSGKLAEVFEYDNPTTISGFPYAIVTPRTATETILDTASNMTVYKFVIRAIDSNNDRSEMETRMRVLADAILAELRKEANETFGGTVDRVSPFTLSFGWTTANDIPSRFFEIEIEVMKDFFI